MSLIDSVIDQSRDVAAMIAGADPATPVPSCPDWTLRDLVEHVGATQRWVTRLVADQVADPMAAFSIASEKAPNDPGAWPEWLENGAASAAAAFDSAPAGAAVFDPALSGDGLGYWSARLFGEVSVHRIDAALATGSPYVLDPDLAGEAIDEWLSNLTSAGWAANVPGFSDAMRGNGETVRWSAPGIDRSWTVRRTEAPLELVRGTSSTGTGTATQDATVTIEGDPLDLLFVISRRRPMDDAIQCTVVGDRAELDHFVGHMVWVGA